MNLDGDLSAIKKWPKTRPRIASGHLYGRGVRSSLEPRWFQKASDSPWLCDAVTRIPAKIEKFTGSEKPGNSRETAEGDLRRFFLRGRSIAKASSDEISLHQTIQPVFCRPCDTPLTQATKACSRSAS